MDDTETLFKFISALAHSITTYNFDKAKELIKQEKFPSNDTLYKKIFDLLPTFVNAEKCYLELGFTSQRNKKYSLKGTLIDIKTDCTQLKNSGCYNNETNEVLTEIADFCDIRFQMVELYEKLYSRSTCSSKYFNVQDILPALKNIIDTTLSQFIPVSLSSLKATLDLEVNCLFDLLNGHRYLESLSLLPLTEHITSAQSHLQLWIKTIHPKENWKLNFLWNASFDEPEIYRWMSKFKLFITEKFALYFDTLIIQDHFNIADFKGNYSQKHRLDLCQKFSSTFKKLGNQLTNIFLVFDERNSNHGNLRPGFNCPVRYKFKKHSETDESFLYIMYKYPHPEKPIESHSISVLRSVEELLIKQERESKSLNSNKIVCHYLWCNHTYFVTNIEDRIYLITVFIKAQEEQRQKEIEKNMLEMINMIRPHRFFSALSPSGRL